MRQFCTALSFALVLLLSGCDKLADSKTFVERGLGNSQYDATPVPMKIGDTYLAIPANYIDSYERTGVEGPFIKTGGVLLFAHWPTMEGRTPANRNEIYSVESRNGYHVVTMSIDGLDGSRYPDDDDEFEFTYEGMTVGHQGDKGRPGPVSRDGSAYGYERYIRQNNKNLAWWNGPTALILRKLDRRGRITSYVVCDSHQIEKSENKRINYDEKNEQFIQQSVCRLWVHHRAFQISSNFVESNRLTEVAQLEAAIRRKIDEFIAAGEAIHHQGGKAQ